MLHEINLLDTNQLRNKTLLMKFIDSVMYEIASHYDHKTKKANEDIVLVEETVSLKNLNKISHLELYNGGCDVYSRDDSVYILESFKRHRKLWKVRIS